MKAIRFIEGFYIFILSCLTLSNIFRMPLFFQQFPGYMGVGILIMASIGVIVSILTLINIRKIVNILWIWWIPQLIVITQQIYEGQFPSNGTVKYTIVNLYNMVVGFNVGLTFGTGSRTVLTITQINVIAIVGIILSIIIKKEITKKMKDIEVIDNNVEINGNG